jgi:F420-non-reducing hydrogenase iron-sulfur subunit
MTADKKTVASKTVAKKSSAKKRPSKKTSARRGAAERSPSKKTSTKVTTAKKSSAKKAAAKKTSVKKRAAQKTPTKKAAAKKVEAKKESAETVAVKKATPPETEWNPDIVVFACNWCSYAGADTAGVSRIQHEPFFRMIRVMCSGRIQPGFVLRAFEKGADGVLVSGCHFGDCHYVSGNERAVEQFKITTDLVKLLGIEEGRLQLEWISAAEGGRFAQVINEFTGQVRKLGPCPVTRARRAG